MASAPNRKVPSQRSRSITNLPGEKGIQRELEQDPRGGRVDLRFPVVLRKCALGDNAPYTLAELTIGLQHDPVEPRNSSGCGSVLRELCRPRSKIPVTQGSGPWELGDTTKDPVLPLGQAGT